MLYKRHKTSLNFDFADLLSAFLPILIIIAHEFYKLKKDLDKLNDKTRKYIVWITKAIMEELSKDEILYAFLKEIMHFKNNDFKWNTKKDYKTLLKTTFNDTSKDSSHKAAFREDITKRNKTNILLRIKTIPDNVHLRIGLNIYGNNDKDKIIKIMNIFPKNKKFNK